MASASEPMTTWSGWDPRGGAAAPDDPTSTFAEASGSRPEARYELIAVAARGFRPPRFLRAIENEELADGSDDVDADEAALDVSFRQTWSLRYRFVTETAPSIAAPYAIYLLGVDPPTDASEDDLATFNDFYTTVHLLEVAERRHALRAVRYELAEAVRPPYQGAPRFLAVYEVDEQGAANRRHVGPPYSAGPDVWQRHRTPWRLWYRVLSTGPTP